jgi:hypothetical protein
VLLRMATVVLRSEKYTSCLRINIVFNPHVLSPVLCAPSPCFASGLHGSRWQSNCFPCGGVSLAGTLADKRQREEVTRNVTLLGDVR